MNKLQSFCFFDLSLFQIAFVPSNDNKNIIANDGSQFFDPMLHFLERVSIGYIVHEKRPISISVINGSQSMESFLSGLCMMVYF